MEAFLDERPVSDMESFYRLHFNCATVLGPAHWTTNRMLAILSGTKKISLAAILSRPLPAIYLSTDNVHWKKHIHVNVHFPAACIASAQEYDSFMCSSEIAYLNTATQQHPSRHNIRLDSNQLPLKDEQYPSFRVWGSTQQNHSHLQEAQKRTIVANMLLGPDQPITRLVHVLLAGAQSADNTFAGARSADNTFICWGPVSR